jgi:hypothetical protein
VRVGFPLIIIFLVLPVLFPNSFPENFTDWCMSISIFIVVFAILYPLIIVFNRMIVSDYEKGIKILIFMIIVAQI